MQAIQYTIRGVPEEVDRVLRERAASKHISLNQLIVDELTELTVGGRKFADFSDLVGIWGPDAELDAELESQRQIEPEMWE